MKHAREDYDRIQDPAGHTAAMARQQAERIQAWPTKKQPDFPKVEKWPDPSLAPSKSADIPEGVFKKLDGDSLYAIIEVCGEGESFRHYNSGKSMMRRWFLSRLARLWGIAIPDDAFESGRNETPIDPAQIERLLSLCAASDANPSKVFALDHQHMMVVRRALAGLIP